MRTHRITRTAWILLAAALLWLAAPSAGWALGYYWGAHPDKERLVLVLDQAIPDYHVDRTGTQSITLTVPRGFLDAEAAPKAADLGGAALIQAVRTGPDTVQVQVRTPAFGYIHFPLPDQRKIVLDFFRDPLGARWKPPAGQGAQVAAPRPEPQAPPAPAPAKPAAPRAAQSPAPQPKAQAPQPRMPEPVQPQGQTTVLEPAFKVEPQTPRPTAVLPEPPTPAPEPQQRPYFAVPYTFRARINAGGPEDWKEQQTPPPAAPQPAAPSPKETQDFMGPMAPMPKSYEKEAVPGDKSEAAPTARQPMAEEPLTTPLLSSNEGEVRGRVMPPSDVPIGPPPSDQDVLTEVKAPPRAAPEQGQMQAAMPRPAQPAEPAPVPYDPGRYLVSQEDGQYRARVAPPGVLPPDIIAQMQAEAPAPPPQAGPGQAPPGKTGDAALMAEIEAQMAGDKPAEGAAPPAEGEAGQAQGTATGMVSDAELAKMEEQLAAEQAQKEQAAAQAPQGKEGEDLIDPEAALLKAQTALVNENFKSALEQYLAVKNQPDKLTRRLTKDEREQLLFALGDIYYYMHGQERTSAVEHYSQITDAITEAMNFNLKSQRIPTALLQLGLLNLKVDNTQEAEAYFNILKSKYPMDDSIPLTYFYWGEYYYGKKQYQLAADQYQYVVQEYPDNKHVREASLGLAKSLVKLGYAEQAYQIVDYIEKRWPRFYAEYTPFLKLMGDVAFKMNQLEKAKVNYWTYYNIDQDQEEMDLVLARLGDIYAKTGHTDAAREVYQETADRYPDKDGGLIALMRLAEEGIYDEPTIQDMFSVFQRPFNLKPVEIYHKIIQDHPDSQLAPLAQLKLSIWHLWNKKYPEALAEAAEFGKKHPTDALLPRANQIAVQSFDLMAADYVREENYERIIDTWNKFPIVRTQEEELKPETRIAVALSYWKRGDPDRALKLAEPFFRGHKVPEFSEMALHLTLSIFLENEAWQRIADLAGRIELWHMTDPSQRELDYALALAYENLDQPDKGRALWEKLARDEKLDYDKKAYPMYFLAMAARDRRDMRNAFEYAQDALSMFIELGAEKNASKIKDLLGLLIDVTESSGRLNEALKFAVDYSNYVKKDDPEWPALRYRLAQLYKKTSDFQKWEAILKGLQKDVPETLYGRMATSELQTYQLEQNANQYKALGNL